MVYLMLALGASVPRTALHEEPEGGHAREGTGGGGGGDKDKQ